MTKDEILVSYYADNGKKLHRLIDMLLLKFGGLSDKDSADFYSLGNSIFMNVLNRWDPDEGTAFETYLSICLNNKICSEISKRNCHKRAGNLVSLDTCIGDDEDSYITLIADDTNIEAELIDNNALSSTMEAYLRKLSPLQRDILYMLADGSPSDEICIKLHIKYKDFCSHMAVIRSYDKVKILFHKPKDDSYG